MEELRRIRVGRKKSVGTTERGNKRVRGQKSENRRVRGQTSEETEEKGDRKRDGVKQ